MGEAKRRQRTGGTKLTDGQEELGILLLMHFPESKGQSLDDDLQCEKCGDFLMDLCDGEGLKGESVIIDCFSKKMGREIVLGGR